MPKPTSFGGAALALILMTAPATAQEPPDPTRADGNVAVSLNPLGFVQFGPLLTVEMSVGDNLSALAYSRFVPLGVLSYFLYDDEVSRLSGIGLGAGALYFFGHQQHRPYVGGFLEYASSDALLAEGDQWESSERSRSFGFIFNAGYRFRFDGGFFVNTGLFLGSALANWEWEYSDLSYGVGDSEPRSGRSLVPFGMLEFAVGMAF